MTHTRTALLQERDALAARLEAAERERDQYSCDLAEAFAERDQLRADLAAAQERISYLYGDRAALRTSLRAIERARVSAVMFAAAWKRCAKLQWQHLRARRRLSADETERADAAVKRAEQLAGALGQAIDLADALSRLVTTPPPELLDVMAELRSLRAALSARAADEQGGGDGR